MSRAKRNSLILLVIVSALTLTLAMGFRELVLSAGQPFSLGQPQFASPGSAEELSGGDFSGWIVRGILALLLTLFPLYILYSLFTPEGRRQLVILVVLMVTLFWLADYLRSQVGSTQQQAQRVELPPTLNQLPPSGATTNVPLSPPSWVTLAVIVAASLLITASIFGVVWFFRRRPITPLAALAKEAQTALVSLQAGGDLTMTIIRCYREMSRVVKEERGIARDTAMTPREFEDHLVGKGLPQGSVRTLTRLFEQVRYGSIPAGAQEEALAFSCLREIADACTGDGHENR